MLELRVPSLAERAMDIPLLIPALTQELGEPQREWHEDAVKALMAAELLGNVRELRNVIARTLAHAPPVGPIQRQHVLVDRGSLLIPEDARAAPGALPADLAGKSLHAIIELVVLATLKQNGGNVAATARALGVADKTMRRMLADMRASGVLEPDETPGKKKE